MAARGGEEFMSDEIVYNKCCVCAKKDKRKEADKYCMECKDYFCASCVDIHAMIPSTEGHKLLNKTDFKSYRHSGSLPSYPTLRCPIHPSKVVDMFCEDHDEVACTSCIALNHRSCKQIYSVPDKIDDLLNRLELKNVEQKIEGTKSKMEELKQSHETHLKELKMSLKSSIDSVKSFKKELQVMLDIFEQETIALLQEEYHKIESLLLKDIREDESSIKALNDMSSKLKTADGNTTQKFVCAKFSEKLTVQEKERRDLYIQKCVTVTFTADQSIKAYLQQINKLGKVSTAAIDVSKTQSAEQTDSLTKPIVSKTNFYKISKQRLVEMRVSDDKVDCNILGACITEDDYLLLADSNNKKIKRFSLSTEKVSDYLTLGYNLRAVCQVSKTEAAVSLANHTIVFISLGDKMTALRTLTFNHTCFGLGQNSDKLFISDQANSLYIYDMSGKELKRIATDISGKDIFMTTRHIAVCANAGRVFVADLNKGLITFDIQGNYLSTLSDSDIKARGCYGLCTDGRNVIVCCFTSSNIIQIGQDNKLIGEIGHFKNPYSLCFHNKTNRLIVAGNANTLLVMELF